MKTIIKALGLAVVLGTSNVEAEAKLSTTWYFRATYETGQYAESRDPTEQGGILMYTGANWTCQRRAVSLNKAGLLVAGYTCNSPGAFTTVTAACAPGKEDFDVGAAGIGDANGYVSLSVTCSTKPKGAAAPAKATSIERNL